jgi:hypothetical protein
MLLPTWGVIGVKGCKARDGKLPRPFTPPKRRFGNAEQTFPNAFPWEALFKVLSTLFGLRFVEKCVPWKRIRKGLFGPPRAFGARMQQHARRKARRRPARGHSYGRRVVCGVCLSQRWRVRRCAHRGLLSLRRTATGERWSISVSRQQDFCIVVIINCSL